jgi:hypothetical protein
MLANKPQRKLWPAKEVDRELLSFEVENSGYFS